MNKFSKIIFYSLCTILFCACSSDKKIDNKHNEKKDGHINKNLNISILLDLSDRIDSTKNNVGGMPIYQRDLGYIENISKAFEHHLKSSKIVSMNDQMQIFFEPEPNNVQINSIAKSMKILFNKDKVSKGAISEIQPLYLSSSSKIYALAIKDNKYVGSDIFTFFKKKVKNYCILPKHRNILIIITDGYMFHKDNKIHQKNKTTYITPQLISSLNLNSEDYKNLINDKQFGFIPATDNLQDLEILVLGINAVKGKPFEEDIILTYWRNWFRSMKVKYFELLDADLPSNLEPIIDKFINKK